MSEPPTAEDEPERGVLARIRLVLSPAEKVWADRRRQERELVDDEPSVTQPGTGPTAAGPPRARH